MANIIKSSIWGEDGRFFLGGKGCWFRVLRWRLSNNHIVATMTFRGCVNIPNTF